MHRLRAWYSGSTVRIDFHLVLSRNLSLQEVSREIKHLHEILGAHFQGLVDILIHSDPCAELHCPACSLRKCISRMQPARFQLLWHPEKLTSGIRNV
ncbi:MAG: cation transporter dimerization domain-containing protein [Syntrophobacteraceae bacterium]